MMPMIPNVFDSLADAKACCMLKCAKMRKCLILPFVDEMPFFTFLRPAWAQSSTHTRFIPTFNDRYKKTVSLSN